ENDLLYQPVISPSAYRSWLRALGVQYVMLPDVALDYSSQAEAALIQSGRSGLVLAGTAPHWRFYRLAKPVGIVSGGRVKPGSVHVTTAAISFVAKTAGRYRVRVRYSPYWQPSTPMCVTPTGDGMMQLSVSAPGAVRLSMPDPLDAFFSSTSTATTACKG
ncbi:MAG: hypothetical protein QOF08_1080, partial [Gaiellales bacterium]|nr:hypothetical protein [Gaiellales bacterium]